MRINILNKIYSFGSLNKNHYQREIVITHGLVIFTFVVWFLVTWETFGILGGRVHQHQFWLSVEQIVFICIVQGLIYGNFIYQLTRIGYLKRRLAHSPATADELETIYDASAPSLTVLIPSYKEEIEVIRSTLLSAALQDYPNRRVVLLIDNPPHPSDPEELRILEATRLLPVELQRFFDQQKNIFQAAEAAFERRRAFKHIDREDEAWRLAELYKRAARSIEQLALLYPCRLQGDILLHERVFQELINRYAFRAQELRKRAASLKVERIAREYQRLSAQFRVEMTSFERKRFVNLSHEPNKAMNINSYLGLMGASWKEAQEEDGLFLREYDPANATSFPMPDFVITLDADSLIVPEYAIILVHEMIRSGNENVAVVQTPYNSFPEPVSELERLAGATTDIQYIIHQGFTANGATFWVGANALVRTAALIDIRHYIEERGYQFPAYIHDRTVIEDTESSIDLVASGWRLLNYPDRLAFSATPPDFGSLSIQRRRWANGGLIILPKLLRHLIRYPLEFHKMLEGFFRIHYLASLAIVNVSLIILLCHSFEKCIESWLLPLSAVPYFLLYARDLRYSGYRFMDLLGVYALNLALIPVNIGGVLKSIQQGITKRKIPFGRTPKVSGRTRLSTLYVVAETAIMFLIIFSFGVDIAKGRWIHAIFSFVNGAFLFYALVALVGAQELTDILPFLGKLLPKKLFIEGNA